MAIWICIPVFNRIDFTMQCLASLVKQDYNDYKIVICDHGSTDGTSERIQVEYPEVILLSADCSLWWTGAINVCIQYVLEHAGENDLLLTLNNDTELPTDYLKQLISCSEKYRNSIVTSVIHDIKTGELFDIGYRQNWLLATSMPVDFERDHIANDRDVIEITHASGRGTLFPIAVFQRIGLYDEKHLPHYAADYDFSFKAVRSGFKIYVSKKCRVFSHIEATGLTTVLSQFSMKNMLNYFSGMRSPANLKARFWYGWNNCPKIIFPVYIVIDLMRITGSYCRHFIIRN
ncbi:glycosyltransferase family 2 protein [Methylomonas sp. LW13]|uniref:glycosyltransferase family 2 protein n=1 Tax=unclassified Methylomonas TaxID=2608980 RepID=UPI00051AFED6|nr:glycosyltransferase family 2 protein [Methylomonas sp. LW13]QBC25690.1 glycosyltransferase family 2 protein [Methylomonas sp. LW13]